MVKEHSTYTGLVGEYEIASCQHGNLHILGIYSHWMSSCHKPVDSCLLEDFTDGTKQQVFFQCFSLAATVCYLESGERIYNIFHGGKKEFTRFLATYLRGFEDKSFGMKSFCLLGINEVINKHC